MMCDVFFWQMATLWLFFMHSSNHCGESKFVVMLTPQYPVFVPGFAFM